MHVRLPVPLLALAVLVSSGCTSRRAFSGPYPSVLPPDQQVEIWQGPGRTVLRNVSLDSVAIRGQLVPWRPACGACSVVIPRAQADSIVLVNHDVAIGLAGTAGLVALWVMTGCKPFVACY